MVDNNINRCFRDLLQKNWPSEHPIVEIGAGTGFLTKELMHCTKELHAIERDRDLVPLLKDIFLQEIKDGSLFIHEENGVTFDLSKIFSLERKGILVGNLPYHLTSSIILLALKFQPILLGSAFMVQKEVAIRIVAKPNSKDYGLFSAILPLFFDMEIAFYVGRNSFWPVPNVDSAVMLFKSKQAPLNNIRAMELLEFVKKLFQKRRKKLSTIMGKGSEEIFLKTKIDQNLRPENLSPDDLLRLFLHYDIA